MNFIAGFVILVILFAPVKKYTTTTITGFAEGFPYSGESMLMANDQIVKINGYHIYTNSDISLFLSHGAGESYNIEVKRNGEQILLNNIPLTQHEYKTQINTENGVETKTILRYGIDFKPAQATFGDKISLAWYNAVDFVRLVKISLFDLFSGKANVSDLSGPVGITTVLTETAKTSMYSMWMFVALIAINLAVMNLLPLPALDGGRIFFLLVELIRRKPLNPKYEGMVHFVGLALFMALMVYVSFNDIMRFMQS
jgi:regulator of sigma E protease